MKKLWMTFSKSEDIDRPLLLCVPSSTSPNPGRQIRKEMRKRDWDSFPDYPVDWGEVEKWTRNVKKLMQFVQMPLSAIITMLMIIIVMKMISKHSAKISACLSISHSMNVPEANTLNVYKYMHFCPTYNCLFSGNLKNLLEM